MSKKNNKIKNTKVYSSEQDEMRRMIKVLGTVVVIMVAFYLIFAIANGEISFGGKKKTPVAIQDVEILAGNSFERNEDSYYVLMYNFDEPDSTLYANIYDLFTYKSGTKMYLVDLGKKFNARYITDDASKVDVSSVENLKVVNGTLFKVENKTGVSKAIGVDDIKKELF